MTKVAVLGGNAYARCPKCGWAAAFFRGVEGAFISEVKRFVSDTLIPLKCPAHGVFEVAAESFCGKEPSLEAST